MVVELEVAAWPRAPATMEEIMEGDRFDDMARHLATGGTTRRGLLRNLGGMAAGAALAGLGVQPTLAKKGGGPKGPNGNSGKHGDNGQNSPRGPHGNTLDGGVCDNCAAMCSNCPVACCLS
jgi:hypothetical protein